MADLPYIQQVQVQGVGGDFFDRMAKSRQDAFASLLAPITQATTAFTENNTNKAMELLQRSQQRSDLANPDVQHALSQIIDNPYGFSDRKAILDGIVAKDNQFKQQEADAITAQVYQKLGSGDVEGARSLLGSMSDPKAVKTGFDSITSYENDILERNYKNQDLELRREAMINSTMQAASGISRDNANTYRQLEGQAIELEKLAAAAEGRKLLDNTTGQEYLDPNGAAQAANYRAQAAQLRQQGQALLNPQNTLSAIGGAVGQNFSTGDGRQFIGLPGNTGGNDPLTSYVNRLTNVESSGNPTAKNSQSSATGLGQFVDGTWLEMMKKYRPDLAGNVDPRNPNTPEAKRVLEMRNDPNLSREMVANYAKQNADALTKAGIPVSEGSLYTAHFLGAGGAVKAFKANPNASAESVLGDDVVNRNARIMKGKTIGQVLEYSMNVMGNPNRNGGSPSNAASALAQGVSMPTVQPAQVAAQVSQGTAQPQSATGGRFNINSLPADQAAQFKPYADAKGNLKAGFKFDGKTKTLFTLDAEVEAAISDVQSEAKRVETELRSKESGSRVSATVPKRMFIPFGSSDKRIEAWNYMSGTELYKSTLNRGSHITQDDWNEVLDNSLKEIDNDYILPNKDDTRKVVDKYINNMLSRKSDKLFASRNDLMNKKTTELAKKYGVSPDVMKQVLKEKGAKYDVHLSVKDIADAQSAANGSTTTRSNANPSTAVQRTTGRTGKDQDIIPNPLHEPAMIPYRPRLPTSKEELARYANSMLSR